MAFCFLAVIILSFFTGIAIGYIIFEFYIMNRSGINFNYVEGEEVNSFLEEIRRSKDNGARMLNYRTNTRNSTDAVLVRNEGNRPISTANKTESLSSRLRKNLTNPLEGYEEVVSVEENIEEEAVEMESTQNIAQTEVYPSDIEDTYDAMSEEYNEEDDASEEDFVVDDEYLKKYYITEEDDDSSSTAKLEDSIITNIEEQEDIEESATASESYDCSYADTEMYSSDDFSINPEFDTENSDIIDVSDTETTIEKDMLLNNETEEQVEVDKTSDKIISNTAIELPKSDKQDKIVSNVCIQLGGTSKKDDSGSSFVAIPLTMTEKPVEPDAPPKRKRGRPRKKK